MTAAVSRDDARITDGAAAALLGVGLLVLFMATVDVTIANIALPSIQRDLGLTPGGAVWIAEAYALSFAACLIPGGALGDRVGPRAAMLTGISVFTLASVLVAASSTLSVLLAGRVFQGACAAMIVPQVTAMVKQILPLSWRTRALSAVSATSVAAVLLGPLVGGGLLSIDAWGLGWRAVFFVNLPVGALAILVLSSAPFPARPRSGEKSDPLDWMGLALLVIAITAALSAFSGQALPTTVVLLGVLGAAFAGFLARQRHLLHRASALRPIVDPDLFSGPNFRWGVIIQLFGQAAIGGFYLCLTLYLQDGLDCPAPRGSPVGPRRVRRARRDRPRDGAGRRSGTTAHHQRRLGHGGGVHRDVRGPGRRRPGASLLVITSTLAAAGLGLCAAPALGVVLTDIPTARAATATAVFAVCQQTGSAVGTGALGTLYAQLTDGGAARTAFCATVLLCAILTGACAAFAFRLRPGAGTVEPGDGAAPTTEGDLHARPAR
ncbi:MFS transporter [Tsukamurella sp. PLM1]|uniref:MFS transporter n=1 Tax=Tsukamurella sp. PLM1 TaxID=2929795 RepID=UPI00206F840A|nr:MFS transporter [Tsukamurella sp. PLM1]BDH58739.1 MFS transporter [Tsukamurella sp. PLM1]